MKKKSSVVKMKPFLVKSTLVTFFDSPWISDWIKVTGTPVYGWFSFQWQPKVGVVFKELVSLSPNDIRTPALLTRTFNRLKKAHGKKGNYRIVTLLQEELARASQEAK